MPKNKLKRFEELPDMILKLVKKHNQMTTFAVKRRIVEQGVSVTWKTIQRYLEDLKEDNQVTSTELEDNRITLWAIA